MLIHTPSSELLGFSERTLCLRAELLNEQTVALDADPYSLESPRIQGNGILAVALGVSTDFLRRCRLVYWLPSFFSRFQ